MIKGNPVTGVKVFIAIAMIASLAGCISDILLLYTPDAVYENMDFLFMAEISDFRLLIGQYLGLISIPFCLMGFWWLSRGLKVWRPYAPWYAFSLMMITMFLGVAYHGLLPMVASHVKNLGGIEFVRVFFEPLGFAFTLMYLLLSFIFFLLVLLRKTLFPRWMIWFNPLLIYGVCVAVYIWAPVVGRYLIVAGFNLANLILLGSLLWANWDRESIYFKDTED